MKFWNKTCALALVVLGLVSGFTSPALASADSGLEGNVQQTQQMTGALAGAKDEDVATSTDLGIRIETFRRVLDLATSEAADLKVQFLSVAPSDKTTSTRTWKDGVVAALDDAVIFYKNESAYLKEHEGDVTLATIQTTAKTFKAWRESVYTPLYQEAAGYVLLQKTKQVLDVATDRWKGIKKDMNILERAGFPTSGLTSLFASSTAYLQAAEHIYGRAADEFDARYRGTATSTAATSTSPVGAAAPGSGSASSSASSAPAASSTDAGLGDAGYKDWSIKSLVRESFQNVKDAYRIFIEMSSLVRKLL